MNAYYVSPLVINHDIRWGAGDDDADSDHDDNSNDSGDDDNDDHGPVDLLEEVPPTDPRARMYRTTVEVNAARDWINSMRHQNKRWMATVSFSSAHTPYQQPPRDLLSPGSIDGSDLDCKEFLHQRIISNQMIEAMDTEIGRLLVETGLATRHPSGHLDFPWTAVFSRFSGCFAHSSFL